MRRSILLFALLLPGCGSSEPDPQSNGVTIALPPAIPAEMPEPGPEAPAKESVANDVNAQAEAEPALEAEEAPEPASKAKAGEKDKAVEKDRPADKNRPAEKASETEKGKAAAAKGDERAKTAEKSSGPRPPLSDPLIAATIRRIGYACPDVTSTVRVEGQTADADATYRINCSSGDTYRGSVKDGRMRFRKSG